MVTRRLGQVVIERSRGVHGKSLGLAVAPWFVCEASVCQLLE